MRIVKTQARFFLFATLMAGALGTSCSKDERGILETGEPQPTPKTEPTQPTEENPPKVIEETETVPPKEPELTIQELELVLFHQIFNDDAKCPGCRVDFGDGVERIRVSVTTLEALGLKEKVGGFDREMIVGDEKTAIRYVAPSEMWNEANLRLRDGVKETTVNYARLEKEHKDKGLMTWLHLAVLSNQAETINTLIGAGADTAARFGTDDVYLMAARVGAVDAVVMLINHKVKPMAEQDIMVDMGDSVIIAAFGSVQSYLQHRIADYQTVLRVNTNLSANERLKMETSLRKCLAIQKLIVNAEGLTK